MRILFSSHVFAPSIGGIETVSAMLAGEFARRGHEVQLITQTPGMSPPIAGVAVHRCPSMWRLLKLLQWSDIFFHNNISLARAWPLLFVSRPWIVAHHVWIPRQGVAARLKRFMLRYATGIAVSSALADDLKTATCVIPNPYDGSLFDELHGVARERDLIFVGRLVSDKGADVLLAALAALKCRGHAVTATIIGSGPEELALRAQAASCGLLANVEFAGVRRGDALVRLLNQHRILVVPSRWQEPFGLVALEGIACGCVAVGSDGGGLREAIGECGELFASGDSNALTDVLDALLRDPARRAALHAGAPAHLRRHSLASVAASYLAVFERALADSGAHDRDRGAPNV